MSLRPPAQAESTLRMLPAEACHAGLWLRLRQEATTRRHNVLDEADEAALARRLASGSSDLGDRSVTEYRWVLEADGAIVGMVGLGQPSWLLGEATLSVLIGEAYQGRGFGTRAMALLAGRVFAETPLNRLVAYVSGENRASMRVCERLGFERVAEYPAHYVFEGRRVSQVCYALRREDWV